MWVRYGRIAGLIVAVVLVTGLVGGILMYRRAGAASPASLTGPNLLQNNDFALDADGDGLPDGWTAFDRGGVRFSDFRFQAGAQGRAVQIDGINNYLLSPFIAVQPGSRFRIAF